MTPPALWGLCAAAALPVSVAALECLAGLRAAPRTVPRAEVPPFVVLMPAHDEAAGIGRVVQALMAQLRPCDELVVIADNCTDDTAMIARRFGAQVVERRDPARRGKGHALEFGRAFLSRQPREAAQPVVIVLDADCYADGDALQRLASVAAARNAVVQGAYLLVPPPGAPAVVQVSCLAFLVKNLVRQAGLQRLSGAALLQGSGMAFPWDIFSRARWATDSLVEDLAMGLHLLLGGDDVRFEAFARFYSDASSAGGTAGQRRRWEHGMLRTVSGFVPRLVAAGLRRHPGLLMVALDLLVPPLVLLVLASAAVTAIAASLSGLSPPVLLLLSAQAVLGALIAAAWRVHARNLLPVPSLRDLASYALWKLPILAQFVTRRERQWIRTERKP